MGKFLGLRAHLTLCGLISSCAGYVKYIVYKTPVTSLQELKLRIFAAIEAVTPQMTRETEYRLDILCVTKGAHVEDVLRSALLIL
jgi:hypothetical protein